MVIYETPAEMVVRHVMEGGKHVARQLALIERLRLMGLPTEHAEAFLVSFRWLQAQHEEHLRRISIESELGLRDKQGNLVHRSRDAGAIKRLVAQH
ncbi:hypothetical protein RJJ37_31540 [Rhizobium redzepovicii]|uniref:Uncharacterized protein n=1 Tax=Rhizobium redzepovicii TaxID=2867518 RepID=A0AAW8PAQ9_9HYPH|nr:hypothetical protein [Rhizobium redzepovicii]MDR9764105.1 hypothetical protein [Rhizobium redzepovicii]